MYNFKSNFNGREIDMLSLGDADSIPVTGWYGTSAWRVLIDGGRASDTKAVRDFLRSQNITSLYAVVSTHLHNDHARGLIKLVKDKTLSITFGWMHNMRRHVSADALRRASSGNSSQAEGGKRIRQPQHLRPTQQLYKRAKRFHVVGSQPGKSFRRSMLEIRTFGRSLRHKLRPPARSKTTGEAVMWAVLGAALGGCDAVLQSPDELHVAIKIRNEESACRK